VTGNLQKFSNAQGITQAMNSEHESYEQRVIVYADIIGWTAACQEPSNYPRLRAVTQGIAERGRNFSAEVKAKVAKLAGAGVPLHFIEQHASFEFSFFSDNLAISVPSRYAEQVFKTIAFVVHGLLREGFLVRGGVTLGDVYHRNNVLFGPALIEAVDLERTARYPRLLCSPSLVTFLEDASYKDKAIILDREKEWVLNIACGGPDAFLDLNGILKNKLTALRLEERAEIEKKWSYLLDTLPQMFRSAGITT
jgi:hypothetical protein